MNAPPPVVIANFFEDIRVQLLEELDAAGFAVQPATARASFESVSEAYFNVRWRLLPTIGWDVKLASDLVTRMPKLAPPRAAVVNEICARARRGESLRPFYHRPLTRANYNDALLNDWGIHHLHLGGVTPEPDGFVARSRELLYAFADRETSTLYLLEVLDHESFAEQDLIEILHTNFSEALKAYRLDGWSAEGEPTLDRESARAAGLSIATVMRSDGTVYVAPGGGYMSNRLSMRVRIESDRLLNRARQIDLHFREHATEIAALIHARLPDASLEELRLRLELTASGLVVVETSTRVRFPQPA